MAWEYWFETQVAMVAVRACGGNGLSQRRCRSTAPVGWIATLPIALTIGSVPAIQTMIPFGLERPLSCIFVTTGLASVLPLLASIHYPGAAGAGAAILIVGISIAAAMWTTLKRDGVDVRRGTAASAISEIDSPARLACKHIGTVTHRSSLSDHKSSAMGIVLQ